jgi:hypothetical protein
MLLYNGRAVNCFMPWNIVLHTIAISDSVFALLDQEARRSHLSPNDLADRLLAERLGVDEQVWRAQLAELLARVNDRMSSFEPAAIESDITAASAEVKAEHHAGRRSA